MVMVIEFNWQTFFLLQSIVLSLAIFVKKISLSIYFFKRSVSVVCICYTSITASVDRVPSSAEAIDLNDDNYYLAVGISCVMFFIYPYLRQLIISLYGFHTATRYGVLFPFHSISANKSYYARCAF